MTIEEFTKTERFREELQNAKISREKSRKLGKIGVVFFALIFVVFIALAIVLIVSDEESDRLDIALNAITLIASGITLSSAGINSYRQSTGYLCGLCVKKEFAESSFCLASAIPREEWADFCENGVIDVKILYTEDQNAPKNCYPFLNPVTVKGKTREFLFDLSPFEGYLGTGAFAGAICAGAISYIEEREMRGEYFSEAKVSILTDGNEKEVSFRLIKKGKRKFSWTLIAEQTEKARKVAEQRKYS